MKGRTLKVVVSLTIAIFAILLFMTSVQANFEIYDGEVNLEGGRFAPQFIQGGPNKFYCIQGHAPYNADMPRGMAVEGMTRGPYKDCGNNAAPWTGIKKSMEYKRSEEPIPMQDFQDAAYVLAFGKHTLYEAHSIWSTILNYGQPREAPNALGQEAAAYKAFYESIHSLNKKEEHGEDDNYTNPGEYPIPSATDVHRITVQDYNDNLANVQEGEYVKHITESIVTEWLNNYQAKLSETQTKRVEKLATDYYNQKTEQVRTYPLPDFMDIAIKSDVYQNYIGGHILGKPDFGDSSGQDRKTTYINWIYDRLKDEWIRKYGAKGFTDFTEEEQIIVRGRISDYYDKNVAKKTPANIYCITEQMLEDAYSYGKSEAIKGWEKFYSEVSFYLNQKLTWKYGEMYPTEILSSLRIVARKYYIDNHERNQAEVDKYYDAQEGEYNIETYNKALDTIYNGGSSNSEEASAKGVTYIPYQSNVQIKRVAREKEEEISEVEEEARERIVDRIEELAEEQFYDSEQGRYDEEVSEEDFLEATYDKIVKDFEFMLKIEAEDEWVYNEAIKFYKENILLQEEEKDDDHHYDDDYYYDENEEGVFLEEEYEEYYNNYDDDDDNYYDEENEYPEPGMDDIHRIALREYYDEDQKKYNVSREDFVYQIPIFIEDEWWEEYEAEFDHVDSDRVTRLAEQYYDTYILGGGEYNPSNYVTAQPTMKDVDKAVKQGGYTDENGRDYFIDNVTRDVANNWKDEHGVELTEEQNVKVRKLTEQYYDKYIAKGQNYDNGHTNQFSKLVKEKTDTDKLKVRVTRSTSTFVVGPFKVEYPSGNFGGVNKFSWITNVRVKDQSGLEIGNVLDGTLEIVDENGALIYDTNNEGSNANVPRNGEEFYLRFHSRTTLNISVTVDFKYLESIDAEAYKYTGRFIKWYWDKVYTGIAHTVVRQSGNRMIRQVCCQKYEWVLRKEPESSSQLLMEVVSATPVYEEESYTFTSNVKKTTPTPIYTPTPTPPTTPPTTPPPPPPGDDEQLDMTMAIEGTVFLDQDTGKTNTGNNEYDNGEQLEGVDVWLYKKDGTLVAVTLTDKNGHYKFEELNAMDEYYVQFVYNGMLYTNVDYKQEGEKASKATETAQNHPNNRTDFNNQFKEIGSEPANYETKEWIRGALGIVKNKVYNQEEVVELFKEVAKAMAENVTTNAEDQVKAYAAVASKHSSDPEIWKKLQFVADIRMKAYTVTNYSRFDSYVISDKTETIGDTTYREIYYEQYWVNLGIKARPTFDLALYKDVLKAEVQMNGKIETYTYDKRTDTEGNGFTIGVTEDDYLSGVRGAYILSQKYSNDAKNRVIEPDSYDLNLRSEEVANGQSSNYNVDVNGKVNKNYQLNNDYDNLKPDGANKEDRLKIFVTYKLAVRNQSGITGAITEIVDYFDPNYTFVDAFVGDKKGNKVGNVIKSDTSQYKNTDYKSSKGAYKAVYLRPEREKRLNNNDKEQYIYVVLQLVGPNNDAGTLLSSKLLNKNQLSLTNVAEINGYKTYDSGSGDSTPGLIDIDSTPGNLDLRDISELTAEEIKKHEDTYEDDTSKAPALIYKLQNSRTIEGTVFEDATGKGDKVYTGEERKGNGQLDEGEKGINGVIVQLVEIKNGEMFVRSTTTTNADGWYGFTGFLPGNYTIRYIYGSDDATAMTTNSKWYKGLNEKSYNGQDYQSTIFGVKQGVTNEEKTYKTDTDLINRYQTNFNNKNSEESAVNPNGNTKIRKYQDNYYWYTAEDKLSDAKDDEYRRQQVIDYARYEYQSVEKTYPNTAVANHKAEVFNSYMAEQPDHIDNKLNRELANELERRTYRFAYTAEMPVEIEYATQTIAGTGRGYEHKITNVDFGIVERPRAKVELTKNVDNIKVTTTDGNVLFNTDKAVENLAWTVKKDRYKAKPPIQVIMDEELINGATVEITYKITVTNNGEIGESAKDGENGTATTTMKRILDYVDNNLTFNLEDNLDENGKPLWKVVTLEEMQNASNATFINNSQGKDNLKRIDLSTQQTLLQTTPENPLSKPLEVGKTAEATLTLRKVLAAESDTDQLTYNNTMETIEIDNEVGRYDHESVPGNQDPGKEPTEDDTFKSEIVTILPPFGQKQYYWIAGLGMIVLTILGVGIFVIKKYVVDKKA